MGAGRYDRLVVEQGATFDLPMRLERPKGTPWNLTGCALSAKLRATYGAASALLSFDVEIVSATAGSINLHAAASSTSALPTGDLPQGFYPCVWDLALVESPTATGDTKQILRGRAKILPEATK